MDGERFRYIPNLRKHINDLPKDNSQCLQKIFLCTITSVVEQFFTKFSKFRELEEAAKFIMFPDSMKTNVFTD